MRMGKYDRKPSTSRGGANPAPRDPQAGAQLQDNPEFAKIAAFLSGVKFRKKAVGGVDPVDVWKKIEELNGLYENALVAERARCNLLIRQVRLNFQEAGPEETDA